MSEQETVKIDDGGPAFARARAEARGGYCLGQDGMSLRDWFAGQALAGMAGSETSGLVCTEIATRGSDSAIEIVATVAFEFADALIAKRKKL